MCHDAGNRGESIAMTSRRRPVIAIDGPAGAGKSTAARMLAERLGFVLVDTGALYRAVALAARERGVAWDDGPALGSLTSGLRLAFVTGADGAPRVHIDDVDRADDIRSPEISMGASTVSAHPAVRAALLDLQRRLGADGGVVLEGRDIGTVVFPDAEVKIFLTATPETRADRRVRELRQRGVDADFQQTLDEVLKRDDQDQNRTVAPLRPATDAHILDSTGLSLAEAVDAMARVAFGHDQR